MGRLAFVIVFEVPTQALLLAAHQLSQHIVFLFKFLCRNVIPDVPATVRLAIAKEEYQVIPGL